MTDKHPITPPDELKKQWMGLALSWQETLNIAAQWGWDQRGAATEAELQQARDEELRACEIYLAGSPYPSWAKDLRAARRPKPPSQADLALNTLAEMSNCMGAGFVPKRSDLDAIRPALERLKELEGQGND